MGDDCAQGRFDSLKEQCEVIYLPRTPEISTSKIKSEMRSGGGGGGKDPNKPLILVFL